jgi:hypothetical protein
MEGAVKVLDALRTLDKSKERPWSDLGTPERWQRAGRLVLATVLLRAEFPWFQLSGHGTQFMQHQSPEWVLKLANKNEVCPSCTPMTWL